MRIAVDTARGKRSSLGSMYQARHLPDGSSLGSEHDRRNPDGELRGNLSRDGSRECARGHRDCGTRNRGDIERRQAQ